MLHSFSFNVRILSEVHLNLRRHVSANVTQVEGPGGLTVVVIVMVTAQIHWKHTWVLKSGLAQRS